MIRIFILGTPRQSGITVGDSLMSLGGDIFQVIRFFILGTPRPGGI